MKVTKEEILAAALIVFSEKGYERTILKDISDRLDVTKGALYKHYESKEALWDAMLAQVEHHYGDAFGTGGEPHIPDSLEELKSLTLRQVQFTMYDERVRRIRKLLIVEQFRSERMKSLATRHFHDDVEEFYASVFRGMIEKGVIREQNTRQLAFEYTAPITVLIHLHDREPYREAVVRERIRKHIDYMLEAMK